MTISSSSELDWMSHNVDQAEVAKFEAMAANWWDPSSEFKPLHQINPVRMGFVRQHAGHLQGQRILDVGCGGGILSEAMAREGAQVTGIDMGKAPLDVAYLHALESGIQVEYLQTPAETLAEERPAQFDTVTCMEMLEHVPDPASVIQACMQLVKPGGHVVFSTINRTKRAYLLAIVGAEKIMKWLPEGTHEHSKFIRPSELCAMAESTGLVPLALKGMRYQPLLDQYTLHQDVSVNYLLACQRPEV